MIYVFDADGVVIRPWGFATALREEHNITPEQTRSFFVGPFQDCLTAQADLSFLFCYAGSGRDVEVTTLSDRAASLLS